MTGLAFASTFILASAGFAQVESLVDFEGLFQRITITGKYEATSVPDVYVAGNIIRNVQLSIVAAAKGANAAFGINRALTREEIKLKARRVIARGPRWPKCRRRSG